MQMFKQGGTCATKLSDMTLKQRNEARIKARKRDMGAAYLLHPDNQGVSWRGGL